MLGSQIFNKNMSISGADIGVPEIQTFGFVSFGEAVATTDNWTSHAGPELVFMMEGQVFWELENETFVTISGNQFGMFPAGKKHRVANGLYPPCTCFWMVLSGPNQIESPALLTAEGLRDFHRYLGQNRLTHQKGARSSQAILELSKLVADPRIYSGSRLLIAEIRALLHSILIEAWKQHEKNSSVVGFSKLVQDVLRLINKNPNAEIKIGEAAIELGYSRSYIHNRFKKEMGMSPSDYAQRIRVKRCCALLIATGDSITDIAFDCGFGSSQYFSRLFKKYLGTTPSDYRQKMLIRKH